jgi:hypothetical protein
MRLTSRKFSDTLPGSRHRALIARATGAAAAVLAIAACAGDSPSDPTPGDCASGKATTPAIGVVTSPLTGASACAGGGSGGAEYVLVAFNSSTGSGKQSVDFTGTGIGAVGAALSMVPRTGEPAPPAGLSFNLTPGHSETFEAGLRAREAALAPLIPAARRHAELRSAARSGGASRAVIPGTVTVGQLLELNTNSTRACSDPIYKIGRVVAVTTRSIVVADTTNPINGFTDADYQSIAVTFDTLVDPLMTENFGAPADIDENQRILLFFTRSVNELTPANSNGSYVGGFFFGRDLFPTTSTTQGEACPTSNFGELFYLLVPDPTGIINGNEFSTADVRDIAVSIVAHEYQHLINASRRMYVSTTANDFEETWLNEGLSHVAEELMFYRQSGKLPRQDLGAPAIQASQRAVDAFNSYQGSNFGRYRRYLQNPTGNSPYADNDSLGTRGATWAFLRYAVDRQNTLDRTLWFKLVNNGKTGFANLREVFGADITTLFRDWSTSSYTDNLTGVAARYQQPSWNHRSIYSVLYQGQPYPLATVTLAAGTPRTMEIIDGGAAYLRFAVPSGGTGEVKWSAVPATMQMSLVRVR